MTGIIRTFCLDLKRRNVSKAADGNKSALAEFAGFLHSPFNMADPRSRRSENAPGEYYVDDTCISCAACWKEAPQNFVSHAEHTYAYVGTQPRDKDEEKRCREALKICPVGAIGREAPALKVAAGKLHA